MAIKDQIRFIFKIPWLEKLLVRYCTDKTYGKGLTKLTPNHYSYKNPAIRKVKRNEVNFELNIANIVDWNIYFGFYEASRENLFQLHPNPDTILDIGANIGEISLRFAKTYPQASIHSFEPFPPTFNSLKRNASLNSFSNIELHPLGLGSKPGEVFFEERAIGNPGMNRVTSNPEKSTQKIRISTLDSFAEENQLASVSIIKIDVEGYEHEVLKGAVNLLTRNKPLLFIELDDSNLMEQGSSAADFIQFIEAFGYAIEHAETGETITKNNHLKNSHFDIICKPKI